MNQEQINHPLIDILTKKYEVQELAHFYTLSSPSSDHEFLGNWSKEFLETILKTYLSETRVKNVMDLGHPDIEIISTEDKSYSTNSDQIEQMNKFFKFRPEVLKYKFLIIHDAQKLTTIISNKLLKVLEEPPEGVVIFLLNPLNTSILNTIRSRAINLSIEDHTNKDQGQRSIKNSGESFFNWLNKNYEMQISAPFSLMESIKKGEINEQTLYQRVNEYILCHDIELKKINHVIEALKAYEQRKEFNQGQVSRLTELLSAL